MIKQILTSAVFAGVATGLLAAVLQFWQVTPLLLEGELYESGARVHFPETGSVQSDAGGVGLSPEFGRHALTAGFNIVAFTGFGLLLTACLALYARAGHRITTRKGLIWGLAGFITVQMAPAMGLPPELPGTVAAEVEIRQIWWMLTVLATGVGLALIAFGKNAVLIATGGILIATPHLIGAPHLDTYFGVAPPELSALFGARSLGASAVSWSLLGCFCAYFWTRFEEA